MGTGRQGAAENLDGRGRAVAIAERSAGRRSAIVARGDQAEDVSVGASPAFGAEDT